MDTLETSKTEKPRQKKKLSGEAAKICDEQMAVQQEGSEMKPEKAKPKKKENLRSRCSPRGLHTVNNGLSDAQRQAVREIGLGSLLETPYVELNLKMCKWLVLNFDHVNLHNVYRQNVPGNKIEVSSRDVFNIIGVNSDGEDVSSISDQIDVKALREEIGHEKFPKLTVDLKNTKEADARFKRLYALYALGCFLIPRMDTTITDYFLRLVHDIDRLPRLNLGQCVLDCLADGIKRNVKEGKVKGLQGCMFFLQLFFLERVVPDDKLTWNAPDREIPLMSTWTPKVLYPRTKKLGLKWMEESSVCVLESHRKISIDERKGKQPVDASSDVVGPPNRNIEKQLDAIAKNVDLMRAEQHEIRAQQDAFRKVVDTGFKDIRSTLDAYYVRVAAFLGEVILPEVVGDRKKTVSGGDARLQRDDMTVKSNPPSISKEKECSMNIKGALECDADDNLGVKSAADVADNHEFVAQPGDTASEHKTTVSPVKVKSNEEVASCSVAQKKATGKRTRVKFPGKATITPYTVPKTAAEEKGKRQKVEVEGIKVGVINISSCEAAVPERRPIDIAGQVAEALATVPAGSKAGISLIDLIATSKGDPNEEFCIVGSWAVATRQNLRAVLKEEWVSSQVVDAWCGLMAYDICKRTEGFDARHMTAKMPIWVLTSLFCRRFDSIGGDKSIQTLYRENLAPEFRRRGLLQHCEKIYVPVIHDSHWYCFVVDMKMRRVVVLDSLEKAENRGHRKHYVGQVVAFLNKLVKYIAKLENYKFQLNLETFPIIHRRKAPPQQANLNDCGIFCMRYLQYLDDVLQHQTFPMCTVPSYLQRRNLVIDLLHHEANEIPAEVMKKYDLPDYEQQGRDTIAELRAHFNKECMPDCPMC